MSPAPTNTCGAEEDGGGVGCGVGGTGMGVVGDEDPLPPQQASSSDPATRTSMTHDWRTFEIPRSIVITRIGSLARRSDRPARRNDERLEPTNVKYTRTRSS
jgi:hypothetical protein